MNWKEQRQLKPQVTQAECDALPEEVNYDSSRLELLNRHIQSLIDEKLIWSGSYCLWRNGKVFADAAIGELACPWQGRTKFMPDTFFEIQSVGKMITAIAILKLAEDGILYINQPVREWIDEFNQKDFCDITIMHLLTHTSGLCGLAEALPEDRRSWWENIDESRVKETWISSVISAGLHGKPGEKWIYSIAGYAVLGEIISRASGMKAEDFISETILLPCEMTETHWRKDGAEEWIKRYNIANETDLRMAKEWETKGLKAMASRTYSWWDEIPDTAGGQMSTGRDMIKFGEMLLRNGYYRGKRIIGKKALSMLWTNLVGESVRDLCWNHNRSVLYGAGVPIYTHKTDLEQILSDNVIFHEGSGACVFLVDKEEDFAAVFQTSFRKEFDWCHKAVKGSASIIWSGIK